MKMFKILEDEEISPSYASFQNKIISPENLNYSKMNFDAANFSYNYTPTSPVNFPCVQNLQKTTNHLDINLISLLAAQNLLQNFNVSRLQNGNVLQREIVGEEEEKVKKMKVCGSVSSGTSDSSLRMSESNNVNGRLARNRATARLRRQRKKQEAERLTRELTDEKLVFGELMKEIDNLSQEARERIEERVKDKEEEHEKGCIFCDETFPQENELVRHYYTEHVNDLKSNRLTTVPNFYSAEGGISQNILNHLNSCPESPSMTTNRHEDQPCANEEDKRKKRLEKNAESARLCRQRKKLYIQNIRLELPKLRHKNVLLKALLAEAKGEVKLAAAERACERLTPAAFIANSESSSNDKIKIASSVSSSNSVTSGISNQKSVMPRLSGWDHTLKRYKHFDDEDEMVSANSLTHHFRKRKSETLEETVFDTTKLRPNNNSPKMNSLLLNWLIANGQSNISEHGAQYGESVEQNENEIKEAAAVLSSLVMG